MILLDTNILLRIAKATDPARPTAMSAVAVLQSAGDDLCIVPQNVYEFWAVATRPQSANGLGLDVPSCQAIVTGLKASFQLLDDQPMLFSEWESLVVAYQCHGKVSFDARLVAAMHTHGITRLLTFNIADFLRYPGLAILDPAVIAATPPNVKP